LIDEKNMETALVLVTLALALSMRPWRQRGIAQLANPMLAMIALMPWLWALPFLQSMPLQLQLSGACLVLLMFGWPLAIIVLCIVGGLTAAIAGLSWGEAIDLLVWLGIVPATLALGIGALLRRYIGTHPFVYVLGRAFLGTVISLFAAGALRQWSGNTLAGVEPDLSMVARWLMAWGDAFTTGMFCAIFVAYRPQWLATWSDALYLRH
jgi:uncharacterized membrane protein